MKKIKKGNLILVLSVMVLLLAGCGKQKVNLSEYVNVTYTGLNGKATAVVDIDFSAMEDFLVDEKADDGENLKRVLEIGSSVTCELDKAEDLSNGDKIIASIKWDDEVAKEYGLAFSGKSKEIEVTGLEEGKVMDLFQDISLEYSGISPLANVTICNNSKDSFVAGVYYTAEKTYEIANGDEIKVTAKCSESEAEEQGYIIEETEKIYTVEGLDEYVKEYAQIDAATLEKIDAQANDLIDAALADKNFQYLWYFYPGQMISIYDVGNYEMSEAKLTNAYFLSLKDGGEGDWGKGNNSLYFVYTIHTKDELTPEGKDGYVLIHLQDILLKNTGDIEAAIWDAKIITTNYDDYDKMYNDIVTANKAKYTCEEISY